MASKSGEPPKKRKQRSKFSEMVVQRMEDADALISSFEVFRKSIVAGLVERHAPLLKEGENLPDYGLSLDLSAREVRGAIDHLVDLDNQHISHKGVLYRLRAERNRLVEDAYSRLVSVRGSIDAAFGRKAGQRFHGLKGATPRKMQRLGNAIDGVAHWLENPGVELPKTRSPGFGADREMWREQLRLPRKLLADNAKTLREANKWEEWLCVAKSRSMEEFDTVYSHSLRHLKAMMIKARVDAGLLRELYPLYQRRRMHKRAREKRAARAEARAAAASAESAVETAASGETAVEPEEAAAKPGKRAARSAVGWWLRKGSA